MTDFIIMTPKPLLEELMATTRFLDWQRINYDVVEDIETLRFTEGKVQPIIMRNNMIMAKGFFNIIEYIKSEGLILC